MTDGTQCSQAVSGLSARARCPAGGSAEDQLWHQPPSLLPGRSPRPVRLEGSLGEVDAPPLRSPNHMMCAILSLKGLRASGVCVQCGWRAKYFQSSVFVPRRLREQEEPIGPQGRMCSRLPGTRALVSLRSLSGLSLSSS